MKESDVLYSWVLPVYNECQCLKQLILEIKDSMKRRKFEIIAVDDHSNDGSAEFLLKIKSEVPELKLFSFKSHVGKWRALEKGFEVSKGKVIITSDSDLQDDPEEVNRLLAKLDDGYDLVSGKRLNRLDPFYKVWISKIGNFILSLFSGVNYHDLNSPFKVYRKEVIENIPKEGSLIRFSLLFAKKLGFRVVEVSVKHRRRVFGKSKFGIVKYLRIFYDLVLILLLFSGSGRIRR